MRVRPASLLAACFALSVSVVACSDTEDTPTTTPGSSLKGDELDAPPSGKGFQLQTDETIVNPGEEVQDCYFFKVSELAQAGGLDPAKSVFLHRIQAAQREGSHHMNIFRVRTIVGLGPDGGRFQHGINGMGECFKSPNWADWPLVANTQIDGKLDWTYPDGVANELKPDEWLMVQSHYVNATTQKSPEAGKVRVNFWSMPEGEVKHQLGTLFATKQSIRVCQSNPTPSYDGTCSIAAKNPVTIIGANGHFHSRGKQFDMFTWDGKSTERPGDDQRFYRSNDWAEPPMSRSPDLNQAIPTGGGVWYTCNYQWNQPAPEVGCAGVNAFDKMKYMTPDEKLDCCYTFGPIVEKNEHCNIFVYYYPKQDDVGCF